VREGQKEKQIEMKSIEKCYKGKETENEHEQDSDYENSKEATKNARIKVTNPIVKRVDKSIYFDKRKF
jgi:hypothetical protein